MRWIQDYILRWAERINYRRNAEEDDGQIKRVRKGSVGLAIPMGIAKNDYAEGQDRISFELTSAVGGRILNVRRYDERKDRNDTTTYVIPSGEDIGARVAKIVNLEIIK